MVKDRSNDNTLRNGNKSSSKDKNQRSFSIANFTPPEINTRDRAVRELALSMEQEIEAGLHLKTPKNFEPKVSKKRFPPKACYYHHQMPGTS